MSHNRRLVKLGTPGRAERADAGRGYFQKISQSPWKLGQCRHEGLFAGAAGPTALPPPAFLFLSLSLTHTHTLHKRLALEWSWLYVNSAAAERNCAYLSESLINAITPDISISPTLDILQVGSSARGRAVFNSSCGHATYEKISKIRSF